jgi:hypothetical protein
MMITDTKHVFEYVADELRLTEGVDYVAVLLDIDGV